MGAKKTTQGQTQAARSRLQPEDWVIAGFRALARGGPQALHCAAVARAAGCARKVPQHIGLVLLGIVGER